MGRNLVILVPHGLPEKDLRVYISALLMAGELSIVNSPAPTPLPEIDAKTLEKMLKPIPMDNLVSRKNEYWYRGKRVKFTFKKELPCECHRKPKMRTRQHK